MQGPIIELRDVSREYPGGVRALDHVSFRIEPGEWVSLTGPSGSGKSTLLNLLDGLDRPTAGTVVVEGVDLSHLDPDGAATFRRERIGLVFQQFHLIPWLSALENVMLAQYYHSSADPDGARAALRRVGLADRAGHVPAKLSGGEQQRVCVARALVNDPPLILADEPTGNLDEENERRVMEIFERLSREGRTLIVATHDREIVARGERELRLEHGRISVSHDEGADTRGDPCDGLPATSTASDRR